VELILATITTKHNLLPDLAGQSVFNGVTALRQLYALLVVRLP
jgi:hypothetical protein